MERKKMDAAMGAAMDAVGRLHLYLLRFLTGTLTIFLILTPPVGIWMISQMRRFGNIHNVTLQYLKRKLLFF